MRLFAFFLFLFVFLLDFQAIGQGLGSTPTRKNEIGFDLGFHHIARQDLLFSPLLYKGSALTNGALHWGRQNARSMHQVRLGFDLYKTRGLEAFRFYTWEDGKATETLLSTFVVLDFRYGYLRKIKMHGAWALYLGAALDNQISAIFMEYGFHSFFGYTGVLGIQPEIQAVYRPADRKTFHFHLSCFAGGWLARSPYAVNDDEFIVRQSSHNPVRTLFRLMQDGQWAGIGRVQQIRWQLVYDYQINRRWSLNLGYEGEYYRCAKPRTLVSLYSHLNAGLSLHF